MCVTKKYKSPINYTGNKYRILDQYSELFPKRINRALDMFTGGATVSINLKANEIFAIDNNVRVIGLLNYLKNQKMNELQKNIMAVIKKFGLSDSFNNGYNYYKEYVVGNNGLKKYNYDGFYKLREAYNGIKNKDSNTANLYLYVLMVYGFNNDLRFNSNGCYNLPVGKTDMNKNNWNKLEGFVQACQEKNIQFISTDFKNLSNEFLQSFDFIYADPPYLITDAVYNENAGWSENDEIKLLETLDYINENGIKFALSNVLEKMGTGEKNAILYNWIMSNQDVYSVHLINYHYRSASYNKKNRNSAEQEVLITNY